jgi:Zn-dependent M32 family carboxypeptidase
MNKELNEVIKKAKGKSNFVLMISKLMHSDLQAQVFHRGTKSYAEHNALGTYYDEIVALIDKIVESYQGKNGIITNYNPYELENYENSQQIIKYFEKLVDEIENLRDEIVESFIQNQIDSIQELIYSTLYKLKNLK